MTRRTELLALAERVEAGETGREIEARIELLINPFLGSLPFRQSSIGVWVDTTDPGGDHKVYAPRYCLSIDAQAALPGRVTDAVEDADGEWDASAMPPGGNRHSDARAPTEPAARLAALLRAMAEDAA